MVHLLPYTLGGLSALALTFTIVGKTLDWDEKYLTEKFDVECRPTICCDASTLELKDTKPLQIK